MSDLETAGLLLEVEDRVIELATLTDRKHLLNRILPINGSSAWQTLRNPLRAVQDKTSRYTQTDMRNYLDWLGENVTGQSAGNSGGGKNPNMACL